MQMGLAVVAGQRIALYAELLRTANELLADGADNFFFMHKPPGLRVRFEVTGASRARMQSVLLERANGWRADGLVESATSACYEPEAHLFGGPVSMMSVHRLFTADALAWLDYHLLAAGTARPGSDWAFSLALLRRLFDAVGIAGWEDRDVWDRIRRDTGRRLRPEYLAEDGFGRAAEGLRSTWGSPGELLAQLSPGARDLVERYGAAADAEAPRWRERYFDTPHAYVGSREATAFFAVFHWNRGALTIGRQSLLAEALARASVTS